MLQQTTGSQRNGKKQVCLLLSDCLIRLLRGSARAQEREGRYTDMLMVGIYLTLLIAFTSTLAYLPSSSDSLYSA